MAELKMEVILQAFDRVSSVLGGIDGSIGKTKRNINDYKKRIKALNDGIPTSGPLTRQQQRDQREVARTTRLLERQQTRLRSLYKMQAHRNQGKQMMGAGGMQIAAATAMGYGASRLMSEGAEFEETMSKVQALTRLQKDSPVLLQLQQQAEMLGETTWATAKQAAEGQAFYAMAGFTPDQIMKSMAGTLDLAKAGNVDIGMAADIGSNILSAFGLSADEMNRVGDILVGTFTRTNTDLEMLGQTMKYVGPIAKGLGISLEEASAMAGVLGNVGIQADQAGTAMRSIYNRLAAGPSMARKELAKLNVNTKDKDGNLRKPLELFAEILEKTAKMGNAERMGILKSIAGVEAGAAFASVIDKGSITDINRIIDELKNNHGEAAAVAKTMSDNTLGDIERLSSAWSGFKLKIFQVNSEGLHKTLVFLTKIMTSIGSFAKENPEIVRKLSYVAGGVMGITAALGLAKLAWGAFQFAVLGNPVVASLAVIGVSIYAIYKNLDKWLWLWTDGFGQLQKDIGGLLQSVPLVGDVLSNVWLILSNGVKTVVDALGFLIDLVFDFDNAWLKVVSTWDEFTMNVQRFWSDIVTWAQPAVDKIMQILQPFLDIYNKLTGKDGLTAEQKEVRMINAQPKVYDRELERRYNAMVQANPGIESVISKDEFDTASKTRNLDEVKQKLVEFQRNSQDVKNQNQTNNNSFSITINAPSGDASQIAEAVKRGLASVTQNNDALLGDTA